MISFIYPKGNNFAGKFDVEKKVTIMQTAHTLEY